MERWGIVQVETRRKSKYLNENDFEIDLIPSICQYSNHGELIECVCEEWGLTSVRPGQTPTINTIK